MSSFCKADWGKNASKCLKLTEYDKTLKSATLLHLNAAAVYSCAIISFCLLLHSVALNTYRGLNLYEQMIEFFWKSSLPFTPYVCG